MSIKLLVTGVNFINELLAKTGNPFQTEEVVAGVVPPQPGSMGKANKEAKPRPPRKMDRREGSLRALSRTF